MTDTTAEQAPSPTARRCTATKANGEPCKAYAANNYELCAGHAGLGRLDHKAAAAKSAQVRRDKAAQRKLTFQDYVAAELEKEAANYVETFRKAASDGDWRAMEAWVTRVHGKPVERLETVDMDAADVTKLSREQRQELRRRLVAENPELLELTPKDEVKAA